MEPTKNRLDDLFHQAKNESPKRSFSETKEQFLTTVQASTIKGKSNTQLFNLKNLFIMISTISTISIGIAFLTGAFSESNKETESIRIAEKEVLMDSAIIVQEHEKVIKEYLDNVNLLNPDFDKIKNQSSRLSLKIQEYPLLPIKTSEEVPISNNVIDTAYRFPHLGYEDIKENNKQKAIMLKELAKFDKKKYAFIPSGKISSKEKDVAIQAFYMQTEEVTNLEYRTFLFDLLINGKKDEFLLAKPDQSRWVKDYPYAFNQPMEEHYFSHPAYDDYPVVAISRKGAEMYCQWLSKESVQFDYKKNSFIPTVRIPSDKEWMYAAKGGVKNAVYPWGGPYLKNSKGCFLANFKPGIDTNSVCDIGSKTFDDVQLNEKTKQNIFSADGGFFTVKVSSYNPNDYGLFCMSGNVAEMVYYTDQNNLAGTKGGSWTSIGQEIQINGHDKYKGMLKPSVNIGFRPVITYVDKNKRLVGVLGKPAVVTPPGTVKINHKLYVDQTEVTNFNWIEYLGWIEQKDGKNSLTYQNALPDTTVWKTKLKHNEPYVKYYFRHSAYRDYPIIGISYEQVVNFCKWRTDRVKELYNIQRKKNTKSVYPVNFKYRLPTKKEWELIASAPYSEKTQKKIDHKYKGQPLTNLKRGRNDGMGVAGSLNNNADVTAPVFSYWPNNYGIYNLIGNVAEMIDEKGIAKGGSWLHQQEEVTIEKDFTYKQGNSWVGFRCVVEIIE